jgi:hypothetical protein
MPTLRDVQRMVKELFIINLTVEETGRFITGLLMGAHGQGKTAIIYEAMRGLKGDTLVVNSNLINEGEIGGIPFMAEMMKEKEDFIKEYLNQEVVLKEAFPLIKSFTDSVKDSGLEKVAMDSLISEFAKKIIDQVYSGREKKAEFEFTKYYIVKRIEQLEKKYYDIARTTGFLGGRVKLVDNDTVIYDEKGKEIKRIKGKNDINKVVSGSENRYKFGYDLPLDIKMQIIEAGEIHPAALFFDEINRTTEQVFRELMNIVLNREVNGYVFPWWMNIISAANPSSQNSQYATREFDPAQLDRFLKIKVKTNNDEFVEYGSETGRVDRDILNVLAVSEEIFIHTEKGYEDQDQMTPSPRSWEMVSKIWVAMRDIVPSSRLLSTQDRKPENVENDTAELILGKVGSNASRTFYQVLANQENNVRSADIVNGKDEKISDEVVKKIKRQKPVHQKVTINELIRYISKVVVDFETKKKSAKAEDKKMYVNFKEQIKHFVELLEDNLKYYFAKNVAQTDTVLATDGKNLFTKIVDCFDKQVLSTLVEFDKNVKNIIDSNSK